MHYRRLCSVALTIVLLTPHTTTAAATAITRPALIVLNESDNELVVVDLNTKKITGRVPVGMGPHEVVTSPDGATAFVANYGDGANPLQSNVTTIPVGRGPEVVMDAKTRAVLQRIPTGQTPLGILMDPDGTRAFVAFSVDNAIGILDLKTMTFGEKMFTGAVPDGMAIIK